MLAQRLSHIKTQISYYCITTAVFGTVMFNSIED